MENKDLQYIDINSWKRKKAEQEDDSIKRNKIAKERKERIQKNKMNRLLRRLVFAGVLSLSLSANALHAKNAFQKILAQNEAFRPLSEDALEILHEGTDYRKNKNTGYVEPQYDHYEIAENIEKYTEKNGELKGDAVLAVILNMAGNDYQNDSRIIYALSGESLKEFLAMEGYESKEEFLQSIKEQIYEEAEKEEVRENYLSNEGGLKR